MAVAIAYNNRCYAYMQLGELRKALDDCNGVAQIRQPARRHIANSGNWSDGSACKKNAPGTRTTSRARGIGSSARIFALRTIFCENCSPFSDRVFNQASPNNVTR